MAKLYRTNLPFAIFFGIASVAVAQANSSTFVLANQAQAIFTTGNGVLTVSLTDLYVNPNSVADDLSAFWFTTSGAPSTASITTSSAPTINIAAHGTYTNTGTIAPGWTLSFASAVTRLDDLTGNGPADTIVGSPGPEDVYSNANGSIAGNGPHNSFIQKTATWTLAEAGVTSATTISNVFFMFGTTEAAGSQGVLVATPEPATAALFFCGSSLIILSRRVRSRSRK